MRGRLDVDPFFLSGLILLAFACAAWAAPVTNTASLGFGKIVATGSAGTVIVTPAGVRSKTGGVVLASGTGVSAASFLASGPNWRAYSIVLPTTATMTVAGHNMTVNTFRSTPSGSGNLNGSGNATVTVGATLNIAAAQSTGAYTGTFPVTLAF